MARQLSRREISLAVLLVGAAIVFFWYKSRPSPTGAPAGVAVAGKGPAGAVQKAPVVAWDLLDRKIEDYDPQGRDLFKYAVRPPSAEELRRAREEAERARMQAAADAIARQEAAQREAEANAARAQQMRDHPLPPQPPPINLQYVGYLGPKNDKVAVFQDGEELLVAKKGETIKGQFKVVDIKLESVVMGYTLAQFKNDTRELALTPAPR